MKDNQNSNFIAEKIFSLIHQSNLAYTTSWEDPRLDRLALNLKENDTILTITSGGCNPLDYALDRPKHIYSVDINPHQNALLELKLAAIRQLNFDSFFELFGRGHLPNFPELYQSKLRCLLSPWAQKYWDKQGKRFFNSRISFYFRGSSGRVIRFVNYFTKNIIKNRTQIEQLFAANTINQQKEIYDKHLRHTLTPFLRQLFSNNLTLWLNCVPPQQRQQVELDFGCSIGEVYGQWLEEMLTQVPIKDNYFWRVCLFGEYTPACCPEYLKRDNFEALKGGLVERISVHTNTVENFVRENDVTISHFVLLDHMDWLSNYRYRDLESEWQAIVEKINKQARIIFRSMLSEVEYLDDINVLVKGVRQPLKNLITYNQKLARKLHQQDRTHIYGSFYIADLTIA
ncbi:MAG: BtaA family protein [Prochloraceae cyanobacterium]|nr:BtaA family protein [Prochloraceae cyanobacterium]